MTSPSQAAFHAGGHPSLRGVTFDSAGSRLQGIFFQWTGLGPRPTLLLLHGIPGTEQNIDIARAIHRKKWNCLVFHYRGCWGSQGRYSIPGTLDDVATAVQFLRAQEIVNAGEMAIGGLSLGGWAALAYAGRDRNFQRIVSMSPVPGHCASCFPRQDLDDFAQSLSGTTPAQLLHELDELTPLSSFAAGLRERSILLVTADRDEYFPPENYAAFLRVAPSVQWLRFPRADHVFLTGRERLVRSVVSWLVQDLR